MATTLFIKKIFCREKIRFNCIAPLILLLVFIVSYSTQTAYSKDATFPQKKIVSSINSSEEKLLCKKLNKILFLDKNKEYRISESSFGFSNLSLPAEETDIHLVNWDIVDEKEFASKLPLEHERLIHYLNQDASKVKIEKIYKSTLDVYNRGISNDVYKVFYNGESRNYLFEPDPVRRGFKKIFDANASRVDPFIYKNVVLLAEKRGKTFLILEYKSRKQGEVPIKILCEYHR